MCRCTAWWHRPFLLRFICALFFYFFAPEVHAQTQVEAPLVSLPTLHRHLVAYVSAYWP